MNMNGVELTMGATALANAIASAIPDDQLELASAVFMQIGDALAVISAQNALNAKKGIGQGKQPRLTGG